MVINYSDKYTIHSNSLKITLELELDRIHEETLIDASIGEGTRYILQFSLQEDLYYTLLYFIEHSKESVTNIMLATTYEAILESYLYTKSEYGNVNDFINSVSEITSIPYIKTGLVYTSSITRQHLTNFYLYHDAILEEYNTDEILYLGTLNDVIANILIIS